MAEQLAGRLDAAEQTYQRILESEPSQPDAIHLLGLVRMEQERDEEAVQLMEKALSLYPKASHFHHNIAGLYRRMGRLADAEARFRQAIELKPDYGEAYQGLAEMIRFEPDDPLIAKVDQQLCREDLDNNIRCYFHFAAGKILDDIGKYPAAFQHYQKGNQLADRTFDSSAFRRMIKDIIYVCSRSEVERNKNTGVASETPTFIVGMPRSGTTLVEQILSSHSGVYGAGELNDMKFIAARAAQLSSFNVPFPNCLPGLTRQDIKVLADDYLERLAVASGSDTEGARYLRIIDKHPLNFQFVGLIFSMFPNARIIHTVRDPLDTCLSCFFQNFTKGQDYSFDLMQLAHFYNDYRRLMEHWESVYPGRIYTIRYEELIADQERETRELLSYMGLEFEEACIDFHKTDRKVSTASFLQVRKPLYGSSRKRWMNYRQELQELAKVIGIRISTPITISQSDSILS